MANTVSFLDAMPVVLYGGQSNEQGAHDTDGNASLGTPYSAVIPYAKVWYNTNVNAPGGSIANLQAFVNNQFNVADTGLGIGPEIALAYRLGQAKQKNIGHIKLAISGSALSPTLSPSGGNWSLTDTGSNYFKWRDNYVKPGMNGYIAANYNPFLKAFSWTQGEADTTDLVSANNYETNLVALLDKIKADLRALYPSVDNMRIVITRIHNNFINPGVTRPYLSTVRAAQMYVGNNYPNAEWIDSDSWPVQADGTHWGHEGQILHGDTKGNRIKLY